MCGRYYIEAEDMTPEVLRTVEEINRQHLNRTAGKDVHPTDFAPVITAQGTRPMQWGFRLPDRAAPVINARSETAAHKPLFAAPVRQRRCLLPASGYYEWDRGRSRYTIGCGGMVCLAGIWRPEGGEERFCILTQPPVEALQHIHDRMPVMLAGQAAQAWLAGQLPPEEAFRFVPPGVSGRTDAAQLSFL